MESVPPFRNSNEKNRNKSDITNFCYFTKGCLIKLSQPNLREIPSYRIQMSKTISLDVIYMPLVFRPIFFHFNRNNYRDCGFNILLWRTTSRHRLSCCFISSSYHLACRVDKTKGDGRSRHTILATNFLFRD